MTNEADQASGRVGKLAELAPADPGWALCLSGGGFRATLFHLGAVERLNELGLMSRLAVITSVSGGSILNGVLATRWSRLTLGQDGVFTNFQPVIAEPVRALCSKDLRTRLLIGLRLNPRNWGTLFRDKLSVSANFLADAYQPLYGRQQLGDLPPSGPHVPRFVFCATNFRTGACWHFHSGPRGRMGDYYAGYCDAAGVRVSDAVAASSAFPPAFSALRLTLPDEHPFSRIDPWGEVRSVSAKRGPQLYGDLRKPLLTDGGVYDNLGVEPVWRAFKTLLVSDAGQPFDSVAESGQGLVTRLMRAADIAMEQVAAVRKRWLVDEFAQGRRIGAIWTLHTLLENIPLDDRRGYGASVRGLLHTVRTDLDAFTAGEIACLENHGYSMADAAVRFRAPTLCSNSAAAFRWPHEDWSYDDTLPGALCSSHRRKFWRDVLRYIVGRRSQ